MAKIHARIGAAMSESIGSTNLHRALSYLTWAALAIALTGSIMSAFGICTGGCTDAERYRFFGLQFATLGIPFFFIAFASSICRNSRSWELRCPYDVLVFGAAGAEWFFISVQKYIIKHYCPVCLTIAAAVYLAVALRLAELMLRKREGRAREKEGFRWLLTSLIRGGLVSFALFVGLLSALIGTNTPTMAAGFGSLDQDIWLGKADSPVEVLFVTDWFCPYCQKSEPVVESMLPVVERVAKCTFIDDPIHEASFNYMPYNMSLLMNTKDKYLEGRKVLLSFAQKTNNPDDAALAAAFAAHGISFKLAERAKLVKLASSESGFLRTNAVTMTPTIVVRNRKTGEHRLLAGVNNIQQEIVLAAVRSLQK